MVDEIQSIVSHVSVGVSNMEKALAFYDPIMSAIGATRKETIELPEFGVVAVAYGKKFPEFWIQLPENQQPASVGNGQHIGFIAGNKDIVHQFHAKALENGGTDNGAPGPRPHYGEQYYGCFILDPDGNKIEATFWDMSLSD